MKLYSIGALIFILMFASCSRTGQEEMSNEGQPAPFLWSNATIYFLLIDRFNNGDPSNDHNFDRAPDGAILRSFTGGDIKGITLKIEEGYFDKLGVSAIWFTPPVEQVHGYTDEGTGKTYGYHGYWTRDWTRIDPNFGTINDLKELVQTAHRHEIRILMDAVINHTGPVTEVDSQWPDEWVRTGPVCTYQDFQTTVSCTLVENLPDIRTESNDEVDLPDFLIEKWKNENRLEREMAELDEFFQRTGYPRAPRFYIIKWLTDYVRELGIDGFRIDTAKHTEPSAWSELYKEALWALQQWKAANPGLKLDNTDFFMMGEVYGYNITHEQDYPMGDTVINFFNNGFESLINFAFKSHAENPPDDIFSLYAEILHGSLNDLSVVNYISSHDDSSPFDKKREKCFEGATKLMLAPGSVQIYYGDETVRPLEINGAEGDANLRSEMNWDDLFRNVEMREIYVEDVFDHWCKLGQFRKDHPAVGAGIHKKLNVAPYIFSRTLELNDYTDKVLVVVGPSKKPIEVGGVFENRTLLKDYYSGEIYKVRNGKISINTENELMLLGMVE